MDTFVDRVFRAAKLDVHLYEEVEADRTALGQSMLVVVLSSIAGGLGNLREIGLSGLFVGIVILLIGWYVWAYIVYFIGTRILPEPQTRADHGELLRTIGFSSSPGIIRALGIFPGLASLVVPVATLWMLVAMVIAVRQALDYSGTLRAVGVCLIGWIAQALFVLVLFAVCSRPA
ncbi:MAG: YIP1 family protein [Candidatus Neomarinimicrobiota bacterium]